MVQHGQNTGGRYSIITVERAHLTVHLSFQFVYLNYKYILINDKLQYDFDLISSKHLDVTGYTFANILKILAVCKSLRERLVSNGVNSFAYGNIRECYFLHNTLRSFCFIYLSCLRCWVT